MYKPKPMRHTGIVLLILALLMAGTGLYAQEDSHSCEWRKKVVRKVFVDTVVTPPAEWGKFFKGLVKDAQEGKMKVYSAFDKTTILTKANLEEMFTPRPDTVMLADAVTGKQTMHIKQRDAGYSNIKGIAFTEEWTYDPATGKTSIQIGAVAPRRDIYGDDGVYRGSQSMFWIKWPDLCSYCNHTNGNMLKSVAQTLWKDYFKDTDVVSKQAGNATGNMLEGTAIRKTKLHVDTTDYDNCNLVSNYEGVAPELLYNAAIEGKIPAYDAQGNVSKPMTKSQLKDLTYSRPDTIVVSDPITGVETMRIVHRDFNFDGILKYLVAEKWTMDITKGQTNITYTSVAPVIDSYGADDGIYKKSIPMFSINYTDARKILQQYNSYNPTFNIEWQVWEDRFREPAHKRN